MREEKLKFKSEELELTGVLTNPEIETKDCIILCHGITVDKDEAGRFTELAHKIAETGLAVFRFDFRAHGESQGNSIDLTITGEKTDLENAFKFLQKLGFARFGICAASFGGGPALLYTAEHQDIIRALCLWNAVIDYHGFLNPELPWPKENFGPEQMTLLNDKGYIEIGSRNFRLGKEIFKEMLAIEPHKVLKDIHIPILFIHGNKDTYVHYEDSVLYSKIPPVSKLITIEGAEHGFHDKKEWADEADTNTVTFFRRAFF